jgi:hypothetical protein
VANTFLSPGGIYTDVAEFCAVTESQKFIRAVDSAASAVRTKCGPVLLEAGLTFRVKSATYATVAPFRVAAIASVLAADGSVLDAATFSADGQLVERTDGSVVPPCTITYSSGWAYADVPADLVAGGYELARHLWRLTLGNQRTGDAPGSWMWPRQASSLIEPYLLAPLGFA